MFVSAVLLRRSQQRSRYLLANEYIYLLRQWIQIYNQISLSIKKMAKIQTIVLLLLLHLVLNQENHNNVTFNPPPPVNSQKLADVRASSADGKLLVSQNNEVLNLDQFAIGSNPYTNFTMSLINRSSTNNLTTFKQTYPGSWVLIESSPITFSCSAMFETINKTFGMMGFDKMKGQFKMLGFVPMSFLTNETNITLDMIRQMIVVSEDCQLLSFTNPQNNVSTTLYRPFDNFTSFNIVPYPSNWNLQGYSIDITLFVSSNNLYRYNSTNGGIQVIFTFPNPYERYQINHYQNRIAVAASNTTVVNSTASPPINRSNYNFFILNASPEKTVLIHRFEALGVLQQGAAAGMITSPLMSKIYFAYFDPQINKSHILAKHVDYSSNTAITLELQDYLHFATTIDGIDMRKEFLLGDFFLVARNGSRFSNSTPKMPVEEAYQYMGSQIVFMRGRSLLNSTNNRELIGFGQLNIDQLFKQKLVVLNLYATSNTTFQIYEHTYGSLTSVKQVVTQNTPFMIFAEPIHNRLISSPRSFQWTYIDDTNNKTNVTGFVMDPALPNHFRINTANLDGAWTVLFQNPQCLIATKNAAISFIAPSKNSSGYDLMIDITSQLSGATINNSTQWDASTDCLRLRVGDRLYSSIPPPSNYSLSSADQSLSSWVAVDPNITTAIASDSSLWRFDPSTRTFVKFYTPSKPFPTGAAWIRSDMFSFVVWGTTNGSAWVQAFTNNTKQIIQVLNYSRTGFSDVPQVHISPNLTKVVIAGSVLPSGASMTVPSVSAYFLDFKDTTVRNITFPNESFLPNCYLTLGDAFLYIHQITPNTPQQLLYYLARDIVPVLLFKKEIKAEVNVTWVKTLIVRDPMMKYFLMTETVENSTLPPMNRVVRAYEIVGSEKNIQDNKDNPTYTAEYDNGAVKICPPGCSDCQCSSCLPGYILDSAKGLCRPCAPGCLSCTLDNLVVCSSCAPGSFLNSSNNCQACSSGCVTCNVSATACLVCRPGQFFQSGSQSCKACPSNCFNCSSSTVCLNCVKGFTLTTDSQCVGCSTKCTSCSAANITKCTNCGQGLDLVNEACVECPANCLQCNNGFCAICINGYTPNDKGTCVMKCKLPCLTCKEGSPSVCLSCQGGSQVVNNECVLDITCNSFSNCTSCGQGLNYILVPSDTGATCQPCPALTNCLQCDQVDTYSCAICQSLFFHNSSGMCQACHSNCSSCKTSSTCTGCKLGYTLTDGYSEGVCLKCEAPCQTCSGSPTYCTSCNSSYTRMNSKCRNNTYIKFKFTVSGEQADVLKNIDKIVKGLLKLLKEDETRSEAVNFQSVKSGSTTLAGTVQPSASTSLVQTSQSLAQSLATSGIPGTTYTVTGVDIQAEGVNTTNNQQDSSSSSNTGLIIGIVVGVVAVVIILVVVMIVIRKRRNSTDETPAAESDVVLVGTKTSNQHQKVGSETSDHYSMTPDIQKQF